MTINVIDESAIYIAGWWARKGERFISSWLSIEDREKTWFDNQMKSLYGENWRENQEKYDD